jgi:hypothetical protein
MRNKSLKKNYYVCVEVVIDTKDVFQSASKISIAMFDHFFKIWGK